MNHSDATELRPILRAIAEAPRHSPSEPMHVEASTDLKVTRDPQKMWMLNFRVRDLDKMVAQLRTAGVEVKVDPQSYQYGRFASLHDPEGNPIQLWQPS